MKKQTIMFAALAFAMPLLAQETNKVDQSNLERASDAKPALDKREWPEPTSGQKKEFQERHIKLMEKVLNEIGVTDEQRDKIIVLQNMHREKMKENFKQMNRSSRKLSSLQDEGASMEELEAAIEEVSDAQKERLRILVYNRREMELILGKEKNNLLTDKMRELYQKHGRRPGSGMPPRPDVPPIPGGNQNGGTPPPPPGGQSEGASLPPTP